MRRFALGRSTFGMAAAAALVAACSGPWTSLSASPSLRVTKQTGSSGYQLIHGFGDPGRLHRNAGGINPDGALIDVNGTLYGTTSWGGLNCHRVSGFYANSCGTVFSVSPSGKWRPLYRFRGGSDGLASERGIDRCARNALRYDRHRRQWLLRSRVWNGFQRHHRGR